MYLRLISDGTCKGRRYSMEDTHKISDKYQYFAIFDGHGGGKVSTILRDQFDHDLLGSIDELNVTKLTPELINDIKDKFITVFETFDIKLYNLDESSRGKMQGSTAIIVVTIVDHIFLINLGDSRAVVVDRKGDVVFETVDHKPESEDESKRITHVGGHVTSFGIPRVNGILSVSRALGDFDLKICENVYIGVGR